jgi:hypothetical protein
MAFAARSLVIALAACVLAGAAGADVWQWVDADGGIRYTPDPSTVPAARRGTMVRVEPGMPAPQVPPNSTLYAPPGEFGPDSDPFAAPGAARGARPGSEDSFAADVPADYPPHLATRRAELLAQIAQQEARIKVLISHDDPDGDPATVEPELREIARRLPALQAELRAVDRAAAASRPR